MSNDARSFVFDGAGNIYVLNQTAGTPGMIFNDKNE